MFPFGSWAIPVLAITGHELFDWFFSVTVMFSLLAVVIGWMLSVVSRS